MTGKMSAMSPPRGGKRIPVHLPAQILWTSRSGGTRRATGKTGNISSNGLFLWVSIRPRVATPITVSVRLPAAATQVPFELFCQGRVVRWNRTGESVGMGATIEEYELRPARRKA